ncbi:MAG: homoserine kinase [Chloroflexi bacterium]|nr:homoserine kinase [Chloroflexota bacterium]
MERVSVRVPATTANLGPGFDCLGMALDIWNEVTIAVAQKSRVRVTGQGAGQLSTGPGNLVYRTAARYYTERGRAMPALSIACHNEIPLARGLGSSAAAIVGGLVAAAALAGDPPDDPERLLPLAIALEGHPDNVTPALFGGCQIVVAEGDQWVRAAVPLPADLHAVLFIPDTQLPTVEARAVLPDEVSREAAVYNAGRVALLVSALATGKVELLRWATQDRLHQPARERLFPAMRHLFRAAMDGGALGAFLSGAGPTVLALTQGREVTVAYEMAEAARRFGVSGTVKVTQPTARGATVVRGRSQ